MQKLLLGIFGIFVIAIAGVLILPSIIDWNNYKAEIAAQVRAATGRDLQIHGDLDLTVLPSPRLSANDVRFANISGATAPYMARLKSLRINVRLAPLLSGKIEVASVALIEPVIELERLPDGRVNWDISVADDRTATTDAKSKSSTTADAGSDLIRLDSLQIVRGTIIYRDAAEQKIERIENLNLEISARSMSGPFGINGNLSVRGIPVKIAASLGRISQPAPTTIKIGLELPGSESTIDVTGSLRGLSTTPRLKGKFCAKGPDLARLIAEFADKTSEPPASILHKPYTITGQIDASAKALAIDGISLSFADTRANGRINVVIDETVKTDIVLRIGRVDLDKLLAVSPVSGSIDSGNAAGQSGNAEKPNAKSVFALPKNLMGTLDLSVDAALYNGRQIRDIKLAASLNDGELTVSQLIAQLPGRAEASLFGFLTAKNGQPQFDGSVELRSDNLRTLLNWWKIDTTSVPADRLRKFTFVSKAAGNPSQIQLTKIKIKLDASHIKGGVIFALGRVRPSFGAQFSIDQLNLDAYAPSNLGTDKKSNAQSSQSSAGATTSNTAGPSPLKILADFDANLNIRIGSLNFRRTPIHGIQINSTLFNEKLTIRDARIRSIAGTSISIKGTVEGFDKFPVFKGEFAAQSKDITGLARILNIKTPVPGKRYGTLKLSGRADTAADEIIFSSKMQLAGANIELIGTLKNIQESPHFDLKLAVKHPELSRLAPLLGAKAPPGKRHYGHFSLDGHFKGDMNAIEIDAQVKAVGTQIKLAGRVSNPLTNAKIDASFNLFHPSLTKLLRSLNPNYKPAREELGALKLATLIKGTEKSLLLDSLHGTIGPVQIKGNGKLALDGKKPKLTASLTSGEIDLNLLLPAGAAGTAPNGPGAAITAPAATREAGNGQFSRKPYDFSSLDIIDADIRLAARAIIWDAFRVDGPQFAATIMNKTLTITKLAGKMFDGAFDLTGKLVGAGVPTINGKVKIEGANVGKALFQSGTFDIEGGIMNYDMVLAAKGRSEFDMISSLNGDGRIDVRDGTVKGFDLAAVSNRLKNLNRATDILGLFGTAMGSGATEFSSLKGTVQIRKGVVRTKDMKLLADTGEGSATGFVDLPRWKMDMIAQFRLIEHPKAPSFGMRVVGRPDNPRRLFKYEKMQAFLLQRGIGALLKEVLKSSKKQQSPKEEENQKQQKIRPEDLIRSLLQGLQKQ